ncbi:MAG: putative DNA binding domain-containing protein [Gemmataceae bacterium]|nr:putative DNA binding domain-containing protein [Gemmataceae bacterium]
MTVPDLEAEVAKGESDTLEFKKTTAEREAAMRTLCGMLNGSGGRVLIGVTEAGKIRGQDVSDATLKDMAQVLAQFDPAAPFRQQWVLLPDGKRVLVIEADASPVAPHTYNGRPYRRLNSTTSVLPQAEYQRRLLERDHATRRWETLPAAGSPVLDMPEVRRMLSDAVAAGRLETPITDPRQALEKLGLVNAQRTTQAAVVAFAVEPFPDYPQCALRLARFRGVTKAEFLDQQQLTGHAFKLLREADLFLRRHLPVAGRFEPGVMERKDEPLFPPLALREALVNALAHRDYSIPGGAVSVAVYDDRVEITSTGTLPFGLTVSDLVRDHVSKPRNPLLAEVFFRRGLIEKWGRGTQRIIDLCVAAGHPPPEFEERAGDVTVRFIPSGYVPPHRIEHDLTDRQRRILHALRDGRPHRADAIRAGVDPNIPDRTLRNDLTLLKSWGLIQTSGRGAGARWSLV